MSARITASTKSAKGLVAMSILLVISGCSTSTDSQLASELQEFRNAGGKYIVIEGIGHQIFVQKQNLEGRIQAVEEKSINTDQADQSEDYTLVTLKGIADGTFCLPKDCNVVLDVGSDVSVVAYKIHLISGMSVMFPEFESTEELLADRLKTFRTLNSMPATALLIKSGDQALLEETEALASFTEFDSFDDSDSDSNWDELIGSL